MCENSSVRLHKSALDSAILKKCLHSSRIEILFVQKNFIKILLTRKFRLERWFGLCGIVFDWFWTYLEDVSSISC